MMRDPSDGSIKPTLRTFKDLRSGYGPNWGLRGDDKPAKEVKRAPNAEELAEHYRKYNLQFRPKEGQQ